MSDAMKKTPGRKRKFHRRKRPTNSFPFKLFQLLEDESTRQTGVSRSAVSWSPDGSSFRVNECDRFMSDVACKYFKMTKYRSFLNIWGFSRDVNQLDCDEWFHPSFQRGNPSALSGITRKDEGGNSNDDRQSDVRRDDAQLQSPGLEVNNDTLVDGAGYLAPVHHLSVARAANTYCPTQSISLQPTVANLNASYEGEVAYSHSMPEIGSATIIKSAAGEQDGCLLNDGMSMSKREHSESSMNEPASIQADSSSDYLSFLHHMIDAVDIDSNIRGDECHSGDYRTE
ncbi:hypothetical protein THAOC_04566 [Thalassiosira oceanica]|uniref:HSF-type DNA-binding domain-containing protein n=1 Tax=Thalassiosira oceanica TaxID=159749 RepID=K0T889_THAOC|nr:hypothetical protein THAOC_04566 [Thalassiosira oceanica]|eukprot:EJK73790.1 hypothetical protein THAOC_04566 [Thalassiosira oceanica]